MVWYYVYNSLGSGRIEGYRSSEEIGLVDGIFRAQGAEVSADPFPAEIWSCDVVSEVSSQCLVVLERGQVQRYGTAHAGAPPWAGRSSKIGVVERCGIGDYWSC